VEPILNKGARMITQAAKPNAPVGPTGNLKRAVRTKKLKRYFGHPAPSISAIDRKKAPHAHLVHEGTGERIGGAKSKRYRGKHFGKMPANPFFKKAWDENRSKVLDYITKEVAKEVNNSVRG